MPAPITIADLESERFFAALAPDLAITGAVRADAYAKTSPSWPAAGYVSLPGVVRTERIAPMVSAVNALVERGLPPMFAYVYDAFWEPAAALEAYAERVLGPCRLRSDGWAWRVPAGRGHGGWSPHRDTRVRDHRLITMWVALTDADVESACMHVVPLDRDQAYADGRLDDCTPPDGEGVALPVEAGTALVWDAHAIHWGGMSSDRARGPRISVSYSFAAASAPDDADGVDLSRFPFKARLDAIAAMVVRYEHQERMPAPIDTWARTLEGLRSLLRRQRKEA